MFKKFVKFIMRGNTVDMAVGIINRGRVWRNPQADAVRLDDSFERTPSCQIRFFQPLYRFQKWIIRRTLLYHDQGGIQGGVPLSN